jgi:hypothetical protein
MRQSDTPYLRKPFGIKAFAKRRKPQDGLKDVSLKLDKGQFTITPLLRGCLKGRWFRRSSVQVSGAT